MLLCSMRYQYNCRGMLTEEHLQGRKTFETEPAANLQHCKANGNLAVPTRYADPTQFT